MSDRVAVGERGQASVTYLLAIGVSMLVFMFMANVLMFLYARGVIRAAVDEGARAGAMASSADVECEARANDGPRRSVGRGDGRRCDAQLCRGRGLVKFFV